MSEVRDWYGPIEVLAEDSDTRQLLCDIELALVSLAKTARRAKKPMGKWAIPGVRSTSPLTVRVMPFFASSALFARVLRTDPRLHSIA